MNHPPTNRHPNPRYAGRDWRDIALGELAVPEDVRWADLDTSVEDATMVRLTICHIARYLDIGSLMLTLYLRSPGIDKEQPDQRRACS